MCQCMFQFYRSSGFTADLWDERGESLLLLDRDLARTVVQSVDHDRALSVGISPIRAKQRRPPALPWESHPEIHPTFRRLPDSPSGPGMARGYPETRVFRPGYPGLAR